MGLGQFLTRQGPGGLSSYLDQLTNPSNPLGQIGKALSQASGTSWGDALTLLDQKKRQSQQDVMQQQIQQAQLDAMTAKQNRNQILQLPNGGIAAVDPDTNNIQTLREPTPPKASLQENLEYVLSLPKGSQERALAERSLPNYGYTPEVMDKRVAGQLAVRSAPTYANLNPKATGGVTATKRADLIGQAQQAIARGADPAKVRARLAQMGVSM